MSAADLIVRRGLVAIGVPEIKAEALRVKVRAGIRGGCGGVGWWWSWW
jgi:hypothetical protein